MLATLYRLNTFRLSTHSAAFFRYSTTVHTTHKHLKNPEPIQGALLTTTTPKAAPPIPIQDVYHIDTWRLTRYLQHRGFTNEQSLILTYTIHDLLSDAFMRAQSDMITRTDMDNETYLYKAAISELGLELKILRQNDHAIIKSELGRIAQDLESLLYLSRDDVSTIKSDLLIDLNNRKSEIRDDAKRMDLRIQQINNKMTVMCSDIKTDIEMMKFDATKTVLVWVFAGAVLFLISLTAVSAISRSFPKQPVTSPTNTSFRNKPNTSSSSSSLMLDGGGQKGIINSPDPFTSSPSTGADTVIIVEAGHGKKFL